MSATGWPSLLRAQPAHGQEKSSSRVAQLREMGFSDEVAQDVLKKCGWDMNAAIDLAMQQGAFPEALSKQEDAEGHAVDEGAREDGDNDAVPESAASGAPPCTSEVVAAEYVEAWSKQDDSAADGAWDSAGKDGGDDGVVDSEEPTAPGPQEEKPPATPAPEPTCLDMPPGIPVPPAAPAPSVWVQRSRVAQLSEMGFPDDVARDVLAKCAWDIDAAIDLATRQLP